MPKVVDAVAQRREIRSAARRVFARRGVKGTGLTHVADAAGMSRTALYHYYPDKRALERDLVRDLLREEEAIFRSAVRAAGSALERIERLATLLTGVFEDWSRAAPMIFDLWSSDARLFRPFFRRIRAELAGLVRTGQHAGEIDADLDPELTAATLIGAVDGLLLQRLVDPSALADLNAVRRELLRVTRRALEPRPEAA